MAADVLRIIGTVFLSKGGIEILVPSIEVIVWFLKVRDKIRRDILNARLPTLAFLY